jgi:transcriptional regulator with XRE-family HTH domain
VAAEAAGLSRVTLHRIESGNASVTMGAYLNVMAALGLDIAAIAAHAPDDAPTDSTAKKAAGSAFKDADASHAIRLADYPELRRLAWHVRGVDTLTPAEARGIYERHARHLNEADLEPHERQLMDHLQSAPKDANRV